MTPGPSRRRWWSSPASVTTARRRPAGAAWLSHLYRLPPKAFQRHLVAGSPETCAAALQRYADAGADHIVVMVAGSPAVEHFALLRAGVRRRPRRRTLAGTPA